MAFIISKAPQHQHQQQQQPSLSEAEKMKDGEVSESHGSVTSHLYLKSPTSSAAALDKDVVLRRIRHHKNVSRVKSAFQALMSSSSTAEQATSTTNVEDFFSSPWFN